MPNLSALVLASLIACVAGHAADAAVTRYVASSGSDSNNCTLNAPCRTLQRAHDVVPSGGEVIVLDSGDYGNSLTINQSITISAGGVTATLVIPGGITINDATAVVALRRLHLKGTGSPGPAGVLISAAESVHIERCTIERFGGAAGISADNVALFVTDSISRNNLHGLSAANGATLTIDNSRFENNNFYGMVVNAAESTITRSVVSGNGRDGIQQNGGRMNVTWTTAAHNDQAGYRVGSDGQMTLEASVARGNSMQGLLVLGASTARISRSVFTDNDIGIHVPDGSGVVERLQNNVLRGNGTNLLNFGTIPSPAPF